MKRCHGCRLLNLSDLLDGLTLMDGCGFYFFKKINGLTFTCSVARLPYFNYIYDLTRSFYTDEFESNEYIKTSRAEIRACLSISIKRSVHGQ